MANNKQHSDIVQNNFGNGQDVNDDNIYASLVTIGTAFHIERGHFYTAFEANVHSQQYYLKFTNIVRDTLERFKEYVIANQLVDFDLVTDNPNLNGNILHFVARLGTPEQAKFLIDEMYFSPDMPNQDGKTPLDVARFYGNEDLYSVLAINPNPSVSLQAGRN